VTPEQEGRIGILDSGVGGLSVLRHIKTLLPHEDLVYFADQAHVPYGPRPAREIHRFSAEITRFLLDQGCKIIVVACNTASAAALTYLRTNFPGTPFVGMEPAVKPGAANSQKGRIGVLATEGTFGSPRYAQLLARYAQGVISFEDPCPGLVEQIEAGRLSGSKTRQILHKAIDPMLAAGIDTLILGCTHYPFVLALISQIAGPDVTIIDPAPAVARQVERLLQQHDLQGSVTVPGSVIAYTTGNPDKLAGLSERFLGYPFPVRGIYWDHAGRLRPLPISS
jgi:glutamate racemase